MDKETLSKIWIILLVPFLFAASAQSQPGIFTSKKLIVIDPGHGGNDSGIISPTGLPEKRITLEFSLVLAKLLKNRYQVHLTRNQDSSVGKTARASFANEHAADLYISIHLKKSNSSQGSIFYFQHPLHQEFIPSLSDHLWENQSLQYYEESKTFANLLLEKFENNVKQSSFSLSPAAIHPFSGLRMPAVLIEPFSLKTLPVKVKEQEKIINNYAKLIFKCIEQFFKTNN